MERKKKILWISPYAPYDGVAHGGGKTHNSYIKYLQKSGRYDITLLSLCLKEESFQLDLKDYGIKSYIYEMDCNGFTKMFRLLISGLAYRNVFDKYGGVCLPFERYQVKRLLKKYLSERQVPDIVILHWTFSLMFLEQIKESFPKAVVCVIEEDVTFLNHERKMLSANGLFSGFFWKNRYRIMKQIELVGLSKADLIITNNFKDTALLVQNGIEQKQIFTSAPYIDNYSFVKRVNVTKDILFFGAMSRPENYLSAIWFIEHVMPLLKDKEIRFVVVGGNPSQLLMKYANEHVIVTGFIKDVSPYFENCVCMVAPLVGGAGIKIKVLEAMSAGVPVLTNTVGIEGISAQDGREYIYCEKAGDYAEYINKIVQGIYNTADLSMNAKEFINKNYNLEAKLDEMMKEIDALSNDKKESEDIIS